MAPRPLPGIMEIQPYKGGDATIPGIAKPVKLASNENPLGASEKAQRAFAEAAAGLSIYPEGGATLLRKAIASRYGLNPDRIVCGAGSDEIFALLARAYLGPGDEIVQSQYAFLIYAIVAKQAGASVLSAPDRDYTVDVDAMLKLVSPRTKLVFIANPNNPTGTYLPAQEVRRLHAGLPPDVLLVIDAAYAEYVHRNDYSAGVELVSEFDNVIMTRTFSKIHGLAAARLGWGYGPAGVIDVLNRVRLPFNVNTPALRAGIAALEDMAFAERSAEYNARELARVHEALVGLGFQVTPSVANFVLIHFAPGKAGTADAFLRSRGYIARPLKAYGLPDALRLSIGRTEDNDGVLQVFAELARELAKAP